MTAIVCLQNAQAYDIIVIVAVSVAVLSIFIVLSFLLRKRKSNVRSDSLSSYILALNHLIEGNRSAALQKLKETVKTDTENIDAYIKLGNIFREMGDVERAIKIHRELTVRPNLKHHQRREILKSLASDYRTAKEYDKSIAIVQQMLKLNKNDFWAKEFLLQLYEQREEWGKAFDVLDELMKSKGVKDRSLLALYKVEQGLKSMKQGEEKDGRVRLKEALKIDDSCPPAYLYLGDSYLREGRREEALQIWKGFIQKKPDMAYLVFERLQQVLFDIGSFDELEDIYQSIIEDNPDNTDVMFALANIYDSKGEVDRSIDLCQQILERTPDSLRAKQYLIKLYYRKGQKEEALEQAIKLIDESWTGEEKFICKKCGFRSPQPLWHCPQCGQWKSFL